VVVGEDRYAAGRFAEARFGPQMHLLDDGFQHRGLARDFDIVLVTPEDARDRMLPTGRLREPLKSLRRADVVVVSGQATAEAFGAAEGNCWKVRRGIVTGSISPEIARGAVVFCGIARPMNFVAQLRSAGIEPVAKIFFRDHHAYSEKDIRDLLALRASNQAGGFVTTEKDAVNLGSFLDALTPVAVIPVTMELADADNAVDAMLRVIWERRGRA
jgi:tetraacyldisaccharide 4'-kinase